MRPASAAFVFVALLPGAGFSQEPRAPAARRIVVLVRDSASKAPLANVGLFHDKSDLPEITDSAGIAHVHVLDAAPARIVARHVGFVPKDVRFGSFDGTDSQLIVLAFAYDSRTKGNVATEIVKYYLQLHFGIKKDYRLPNLLERGNFYQSN